MRRSSVRGPALCAVAAGAVALLSGCGGGLTDQGENVVNGKELFVARCGSCHVLERAGTRGVTGPNLDQAFARARADGFGESTFEGIVHRQIEIPARNPQVDPKTGKVLPLMPPNLVEGDDAEDVAAYVAQAAGRRGEDTGQLAAVGAATAEGTAEAENGVLEIPADPGGALAYTFADAEAPPGAARDQLAERVLRGPQHRPRGQRRQRGRAGRQGRRRLHDQRERPAGRVPVLLHGDRPSRGRHGGHAHRGWLSAGARSAFSASSASCAARRKKKHSAKTMISRSSETIMPPASCWSWSALSPSSRSPEP